MTHHDARIDHWLQMELDGELDREAEQGLAGAEGESLSSAREEWAAFGRLLEEDRLVVGADFRERVLCALPEPAWAGRARTGWWLPVALAACFAVLSVVILAGSGALGGTMFGTALVLADFFQASLVVGAGLFAASWEGVARGLEELATSASGLGLVALGAAALAINGLLVAMLRRRRASSVTVERD